jgi:ATP-dependent DNA helicase DinG
MGELDIEAILGPGGSIARRIKNYEHRNEQMAMAHAVEEALRNRHHLIVEAGTGVGKSFGYLVPAILHATAVENAMETRQQDAPPNGGPSTTDGPSTKDAPSKKKTDDEEDDDTVKRIVISTHTISLQEQLISKDLPLLNAVIPREFSSVLVKGRGNYISRRRLELAESRAINLLSQEKDYEQLQAIKDWTRTTHDGSLSSLGFRPNGSVWDEVASDSGNCMGRKCPTFDSCFYYAARRRVHNAHSLAHSNCRYHHHHANLAQVESCRAHSTSHSLPRKLCPFCQRFQLLPSHVTAHGCHAAVGTREQVFLADKLQGFADGVGHLFRGFNHIGRHIDHAHHHVFAFEQSDQVHRHMRMEAL